MAQTEFVGNRIKSKKNQRFDVMTYGAENLYPEFIENAIASSTTATGCLIQLEKFIFGDGGDNLIYKTILNNRNLRYDQFLRKVIKSFCKFKGVAVLVQYNALLEPSNFVVLDFKNIRLATVDDFGNINRCYYSDNWSDAKCQKIEYTFFSNYNKIELANKINKCKGDTFEKKVQNFVGEVFYYGENGEIQYPLSKFDVCRDDMVTEGLLSKGKNCDVTTNFNASCIIVYPENPINLDTQADNERGDLEPYTANQSYRVKQDSDEEFNAFQQNITSAMGVENTGNAVVFRSSLRDAEGRFIKPEILPFPTNSFDKAHEFTEKSCRENIMISTNVRPELFLPSSNAFNTQTMVEVFNFMNNNTKYDRLIIEEIMQTLFSKKFPNANFSIKPLMYTDYQQLNTVNNG